MKTKIVALSLLLATSHLACAFAQPSPSQQRADPQTIAETSLKSEAPTAERAPARPDQPTSYDFDEFGDNRLNSNG